LGQSLWSLGPGTKETKDNLTRQNVKILLRYPRVNRPGDRAQSESKVKRTYMDLLGTEMRG